MILLFIIEFKVYLYFQCGWTVVHFAAYNGHLEMLQELLDRFNCEADKRDKKVRLLKWFGVYQNFYIHALM